MKYLLSLLLLILFISCKEKNTESSEKISEKIVLMQTDKDFSRLSEEKGMKNAFIEYIDSNGVVLRPEQLPVAGANAIDYLIQVNDTGYTMTWQPHNSNIAAGGDMGYTFGIYSIRPHSVDTTLYGTYVTIWKKQKDGKWKFILQSENSGIGEQLPVP